MLNRPTPGLRVRHNSNSHQKVDIGVPAGEELVVPLEVALQLVEASTHFEVDPADVAAEQARRAAEEADADRTFTEEEVNAAADELARPKTRRKNQN